MNKLSINLRKLRQRYGYSQEYIGEHIHLDRSAYARYELGETEPPLQTLIRLADFYNVDLDSLVGRSMEKTSKESLDAIKSTDKQLIDDALKSLEDKVYQLKDIWRKIK